MAGLKRSTHIRLETGFPTQSNLTAQIGAATEAARAAGQQRRPGHRGGRAVPGVCEQPWATRSRRTRSTTATPASSCSPPRTEGDRTFATVFIPEGKLKNFLAKIDRYKTQNSQQRKDKGPKNKELVESIESIQLPVVRDSFWTDAPELFPANPDERFVAGRCGVRTTSQARRLTLRRRSPRSFGASALVSASRSTARWCQLLPEAPPS